MIKLILTVGGISSGKSTWAKAQVAANPTKIARVSRDDFRNMLSGYVFSDSNEKLVNSLRDIAIKKALLAGYDVIVDETHVDKGSFKKAVKFASSINVDVEVSEKIFYEDLNTLLERNSSRTGTARIPDDIVIKFWEKLGKEKLRLRLPRLETIKVNDKNYVEISKSINDDSLPKAILIDLDGTLSIFNDHSNRYPFAHSRNPYDAQMCHLDSPNKQIIKLIELFYNDGFNIIFCSGRKDIFKLQTQQFLDKHIPSNISYDLFMRKSDDERKDFIIKEELLLENVIGIYNIFFALDDRSCVVDHYRKMGINVWQVAPGDF